MDIRWGDNVFLDNQHQSVTVAVTNISRHSDYQGDGTDPDLLVLEVGDDTPMASVPLDFTAVSPGDMLIMTGYGCQGLNEKLPPTGIPGYFKVTYKKVSQVNPLNYILPIEDPNGQSVSGACRGDSGGPIYKVQKDGSFKIAGVNSRVYIPEVLAKGVGSTSERR